MFFDDFIVLLSIRRAIERLPDFRSGDLQRLFFIRDAEVRHFKIDFIDIVVRARPHDNLLGEHDG